MVGWALKSNYLSIYLLSSHHGHGPSLMVLSTSCTILAYHRLANWMVTTMLNQQQMPLAVMREKNSKPWAQCLMCSVLKTSDLVSRGHSIHLHALIINDIKHRFLSESLSLSLSLYLSLSYTLSLSHSVYNIDSVSIFCYCYCFMNEIVSSDWLLRCFSHPFPQFRMQDFLLLL